jgi:hypothetical protein
MGEGGERLRNLLCRAMSNLIRNAERYDNPSTVPTRRTLLSAVMSMTHITLMTRSGNQRNR